ncbi:MAG: DUF2474 family protein [Rhodospirillales bacterium]|nr:DUF2474 family protein [Rhodospirillales bacterium]QQS14602.1 MAG: DUF2474 family protein [Rhodospirillales bacterium]
MRDEAPAAPRPSTARRLAWFAGLWVAGVATLALIAALIRLALRL